MLGCNNPLLPKDWRQKINKILNHDLKELFYPNNNPKLQLPFNMIDIFLELKILMIKKDEDGRIDFNDFKSIFAIA